MTRPARPKSLTKLLAEAQIANAKAAEALHEIDLRTTRGELRDSIREARVSTVAIDGYVNQALRLSAPAATALRAAG